jgi:AraC-like DNA-binding protein
MNFQEEIRRRGFLFLSGEPGVMPALHRHREVEVNLVVSGELMYLFGGSRVVVPAGQVAVFWAMIPHQVVGCAEGTRFYCVHLPLARFLQWQLPRELTSRLLHGEMVREQDETREARDRSLFEQWRADLEESSPDVNHVVLLELEARLRRLAWGSGAAAEAARSGEAASDGSRWLEKVEQMAVFITEHYHERITTGDIAVAAGLHPKYATALFQERCGMTLREYLTQQRLSQALRLLATTDGKVVDVAFASGFGSVSQFYDVFTRYCGQSPNHFRASQK